ncbi:MAG TPA: hypothetical protein VGZ23_09450 [bacterium]|nr:hypothetical protein [bacterium]
MRKALAMILIGGSLAVAATAAFANEAGGLNNGSATRQHRMGEFMTGVVLSNGTDSLSGTTGTQDRDHEFNR